MILMQIAITCLWERGRLARSVRRPAGRVVSITMLATLASVPCVSHAADPAPLRIKASDVLTPARPETVQITGRLGDKLNLCISNRLLAQDIEAVVAPYRAKTEAGSADWRCEYWGKWFTSLALADAYHSTEASRAKLDQAASELFATAAPDGYLGTRQPQHRLEGWDVWGCKYALLGALAFYDRAHDQLGLNAAKREGDVLIAELGPGKTNIADVGEWNGLPASSVLEPIVQLYERSGEQKYLDFAKHIVSCWSQPSKRLPNGMRLIEDALANKELTQMCAPKSYEMMSCFEGLCELYRASGNHTYLEAATKIADAVQSQEETLIGCGTSGEVWFGGANKQTGVVQKPMETCVTTTWMKLNYQLLRLTGEPRYADELEKNLYNGLLGAQMPDGRWWAYFSGLMGVRVPSYVQHDDVGLSCCVVNGPRGLLLTPLWAFMSDDAGLVINLYAPGRAQMTLSNGDVVALEIHGDYPVGDHVAVRITLDAPEEFTLALRIPDWSKKTRLTINGTAKPVTAGSYAKIHRVWKSGDRVELIFDMRGRIVEAPDGNGQIAVVRGPIVLSLDNRLTPQGGQGDVTIDRHPGSYVDLKPDREVAAKIGAWMAFDVRVEGAAHKLTFCDYQSAGNAFSRENTFRTWLPQPLDLSTAFETGQTWQTLSHANHWTTPPKKVARLLDPAHDLALAANGATVQSDSEYANEPGCTSKVIDGVITSTYANFANRWHSSLDKPHPHWVEVDLPKPEKVGSVVVSFADPDGYPVHFEGIVHSNSRDLQIFNVPDNTDPNSYESKFDPLVIDSFRFVIYSSANPKYPNAAQISEIELYPPSP